MPRLTPEAPSQNDAAIAEAHARFAAAGGPGLGRTPEASAIAERIAMALAVELNRGAGGLPDMLMDELYPPTPYQAPPRRTLAECAESARDTSTRQIGIVFVTHTKARGYRVEWADVRMRSVVQEWSKGRRFDAAAVHPYDLTTEAAKGSIK